MAIDLRPEEIVALRRVWNTSAGGLIKGTLKSFVAAFENHPDKVFTGADVARIAAMSIQEMEKALGVYKEDNGHSE
jgi:hypothetical protein